MKVVGHLMSNMGQKGGFKKRVEQYYSVHGFGMFHGNFIWYWIKVIVEHGFHWSMVLDASQYIKEVNPNRKGMLMIMFMYLDIVCEECFDIPRIG